MSVNIDDGKRIIYMARTGERLDPDEMMRSEEEIIDTINRLQDAVDLLQNEDYRKKNRISNEKALMAIAQMLAQIDILLWVCNV